MKKKSRITGEIDDIEIIEISIPKDKIIGVVTHQDGVQCKFTYSRRTFDEEWEDYEEPKRMWIIDTMNDRIEDFDIPINSPFNKQIGNYFETKEEAEKAVEKLKAWKRLKDNGFEFISCSDNDADFKLENGYEGYIYDLDLLFGGEENV